MNFAEVAKDKFITFIDSNLENNSIKIFAEVTNKKKLAKTGKKRIQKTHDNYTYL